MASSCSSFADCLTPDPLEGTPAYDKFTSFSNILVFSINLIAYVTYAILLVYVLYSLSMGIYKLIFIEDQRTFEVVKQSITNAVLGSLGMILVMSVRFILVEILRLVGIASGENIFFNLPF